MKTLATIRVQSLHVTKEAFWSAQDAAEKAALKGYRQHPSYGELDMLARYLATPGVDPNAWTYLPDWALSPLQQRRKSIAS